MIVKIPLERFENDNYFLYLFEHLIVKTDRWNRKENDRVIAIGQSAYIIMNYIRNNSLIVKDKDVLDLFAGSGVFGLLSLYLKAKSVDFVEINERSTQFIIENIHLNKFDKSRYKIYNQDMVEFNIKKKYDVILANPPFVPVPEGVDFPVHSNGGKDGNYLFNNFLTRIDSFLKPTGRAIFISFQLEYNDTPVIIDNIRKNAVNRDVKITKLRSKSFSLESIAIEYINNLPEKKDIILSWKDELEKKYKGNLSYNYYIFDIKERGSQQNIIFRNYDGSEYGNGFFEYNDNYNRMAKEIKTFIKTSK